MTAIPASITSVFRNSRAPKMSQPSPSETEVSISTATEHSPRAGQAQPESREDVGQGAGEDNLPEELAIRRAHRLRRADPDLLYRLYARPGVEDDGESRCECDEKDGRKITEAEPQDEKRRIGQTRNRIADADERQEEILGPAVPADDDPKPHSEQRGEQECEQQTEQRVQGVEGKNSVGDEANEGGGDRFDGRKKFLRERPEKRERLPGARCYDEGKDKLRKGDKPSSHFGRRLSDEMVWCQLAQAAEILRQVSG